MVNGIVFIIAVIIMVLWIPWNRRGLLSSGPKQINLFIEWLNEIHEGEAYTLKIINDKARSDSRSLKIKYNFGAKRGTLYDKALEKYYRIIFIDNKFHTLEK